MALKTEILVLFEITLLYTKSIVCFLSFVKNYIAYLSILALGFHKVCVLIDVYLYEANLSIHGEVQSRYQCNYYCTGISYREEHFWRTSWHEE